MCVSGVVFFFQAEDGIRDIGVTGVQTCALPIWPARRRARRRAGTAARRRPAPGRAAACRQSSRAAAPAGWHPPPPAAARSEERRVGEECRYLGAPDYLKKIQLSHMRVLPADTTC